jgi:4-amino-4-deoxy-L-arabinose transferase-like glycosyltransferase
MQMKSIASFFAPFPTVWSVKAVPLVLMSLAALAVVASLTVQKYELVEVNAAEPLRVTVLGPFVFGIVNVPVTTCCDVRVVLLLE